MKKIDAFGCSFGVSKIINKPHQSFINPKLINANNFNPETVKEFNDLNSKHFTLMRTVPIKVNNEEEEKLKALVIEHPIFLKDKLTDHEINQKVFKLLSKNFCKVSNMEATNNMNMVSNMVLLRNYEVETYKQMDQKGLKEIRSKK